MASLFVAHAENFLGLHEDSQSKHIHSIYIISIVMLIIRNVIFVKTQVSFPSGIAVKSNNFLVLHWLDKQIIPSQIDTIALEL